MKVHKRLGEILVESNKITREQLRKALSDTSIKGSKIGEKLVALGFIDDATLYDALSKQLKIPIIPAEKFKQLLVNPEALKLIPEHFASKNVIFPIQFDSQKNSVSVAMMDPTDDEILKEIKILCQTEKVKRYLAQRSSILEAISHYYGAKTNPSPTPAPSAPKPTPVKPPVEMHEKTQTTTQHKIKPAVSRPPSSAGQHTSRTELTENTELNPEMAAKVIAQDLLEEQTEPSVVTQSKHSLDEISEVSRAKSLGRIPLKKQVAEIKIAPSALTGKPAVTNLEVSHASAPRIAVTSSTALLAGEHHILLIDDHQASRNVAEQILGTDGYHVTACESVGNAVQSLKSGKFDLLLLKSNLTPQLEEIRSAIPKSGYRLPQIRVFSTISKSLLGSPVEYDSLSQTLFQMTDYLISLFERKQPDQRRYAHTIAKYSRLVAQRLHLTLLQVDEVYLSAFLQDIWKTFVDLAPEEPQEGEERRYIVDFFSDQSCPYQIVPIIKHIGEFYSGAGKPDGLREDEIPIGSRIISVVRAFEDMLRSKIIKEIKEVEKVSKLLRKAAGKKFDPKCVEAFVAILEAEAYLETTGVKPIADAKHDILIVDKDPQATSLLELRLINEGFSVQVVRDGQEAWRIIEQTPPMLIVSDVVVPKIDGFNLCEMVKSNSQTQSIPFFFVSSRKDDFNMTKGLEMGADDYQTKPVNVPFLITKIRKTLEALPAKAAGAAQPAGGGVSGTLSQMGLVEIIQILGGGTKTALIQITNAKGGETADLYMERGRIVRASTGSKKGEEAFYHTMTWLDGNFTIKPDLTTKDKNINNSNDFLLLEAMRRLDESKAETSAVS